MSFTEFIASDIAAHYAAMTFYSVSVWFAWFAVVTIAAVLSTGRPAKTRQSGIIHLLMLILACIPFAIFADLLSEPQAQRACVYGLILFFLSRMTWRNLMSVGAQTSE